MCFITSSLLPGGDIYGCSYLVVVTQWSFLVSETTSHCVDDTLLTGILRLFPLYFFSSFSALSDSFKMEIWLFHGNYVFCFPLSIFRKSIIKTLFFPLSIFRKSTTQTSPFLSVSFGSLQSKFSHTLHLFHRTLMMNFHSGTGRISSCSFVQ